MSDIISCNIQQYADDTKLYSLNTNYNDSTQFQEDLDRVTNWSKKWQLKFNINKCKYMQIGHDLVTGYTLINDSDGERITLDKTADENDLGIRCTNMLSPSLQCHKASSKAMKSLGLIKNTFKYINQQSLPFCTKPMFTLTLNIAFQFGFLT